MCAQELNWCVHMCVTYCGVSVWYMYVVCVCGNEGGVSGDGVCYVCMCVVNVWCV